MISKGGVFDAPGIRRWFAYSIKARYIGRSAGLPFRCILGVRMAFQTSNNGDDATQSNISLRVAKPSFHLSTGKEKNASISGKNVLSRRVQGGEVGTGFAS